MEVPMEKFVSTPRTALKRMPQRGTFDREAVYSILDEGFVCQIGFEVEGQPYVIPTSYGRIDDTLYVHGSAASRMMRTLAGDTRVCLTVTLVDGLVLARSAFHHSINYRSVVIFGVATMVEDLEEKKAALQAFTEHLIPGRWSEVREPNEQAGVEGHSGARRAAGRTICQSQDRPSDRRSIGLFTSSLGRRTAVVPGGDDAGGGSEVVTRSRTASISS
jgi:nitroimidazol reductase NimA-like FMN-containing flavoprotein (pyridoxamine 5'-phosphate oxidase superfamily)